MRRSDLFAALIGSLVGCVLVLVACRVAPAAESHPMSSCLPVEEMAKIIQEVPSAHFRRVADDKVALALRMYSRGTGNTYPWTLVYLADQDDHDGGMMLVGAEEQICRWVIIPESSWRQIISILEGDPS